MIHQHVKRVGRKHIREVVIYGIVGLSALVIQDLIYWVLHKYYLIFPSIAMIIGNIGGMLVAYTGHIKFTFKKHRFSKAEFSKFVITSMIGLCFNVLGVRVLTKIFLLAPKYGLLPTFIAPIITFLISKFWAFR